MIPGSRRMAQVLQSTGWEAIRRNPSHIEGRFSPRTQLRAEKIARNNSLSQLREKTIQTTVSESRSGLGRVVTMVAVVALGVLAQDCKGKEEISQPEVSRPDVFTMDIESECKCKQVLMVPQESEVNCQIFPDIPGPINLTPNGPIELITPRNTCGGGFNVEFSITIPQNIQIPQNLSDHLATIGVAPKIDNLEMDLANHQLKGKIHFWSDGMGHGNRTWRYFMDGVSILAPRQTGKPEVPLIRGAFFEIKAWVTEHYICG